MFEQLNFKLFLCLSFLLFSSSYIVFSSMRRSQAILVARGFGASSKFPFSGKLRPGAQSPMAEVPRHIIRPDYAADGIPKALKGSPWDVRPQSDDTIKKMRVAGRFAREVLDEAVRMVRPGITTDDIDKLVHQETIKRNSYPSPLNYSNFPKSCCTSLNEVICHGIPDSTVLKSGDIINIDVTVYHDGVHGDCSETVFVGDVDERARDLVKTTFDAWQAAIAICKPGTRYSAIGRVIEDVVAPRGYRSVKEFCGHGINSRFHDFPNILHYRNSDRLGVMSEGHTFTIEPMICVGSARPLLWPDGWTVTTSDGSLTAQFEHTLLVTKDGVEALTAKLPTSPKYAWEL